MVVALNCKQMYLSLYDPHFCRQSLAYGIPPLLLASYGGCFLVKKCAELAYSKHKRSMLAGDMVLEIPTVLQSELEEQEQESNTL